MPNESELRKERENPWHPQREEGHTPTNGETTTGTDARVSPTIGGDASLDPVTPLDPRRVHENACTETRAWRRASMKTRIYTIHATRIYTIHATRIYTIHATRIYTGHATRTCTRVYENAGPAHTRVSRQNAGPAQTRVSRQNADPVQTRVSRHKAGPRSSNQSTESGRGDWLWMANGKAMYYHRSR